MREWRDRYQKLQVAGYYTVGQHKPISQLHPPAIAPRSPHDRLVPQTIFP